MHQPLYLSDVKDLVREYRILKEVEPVRFLFAKYRIDYIFSGQSKPRLFGRAFGRSVRAIRIAIRRRTTRWWLQTETVQDACAAYAQSQVAAEHETARLGVFAPRAPRSPTENRTLEGRRSLATSVTVVGPHEYAIAAVSVSVSVCPVE
jgi:hypothetical protein